jgi:hypothetical protein
MTRRVLVTGSRQWVDQNLLQGALLQQHRRAQADGEDMVVIHGGARGADTMAETWVRQLCAEDLTSIPVPADWDTYGLRAGALRNQWMIDQAEPHICLAFIHPGKSRGTQDCIRRARKAGVEVLVYEEAVIHG